MATKSVWAIYASDGCEIDLARRELRVLGAPMPVGGRAFEIIEVLARSAGELVTKDELMNRVWPGAIVMDATLHVHAAALRKALGPYRGLLKTEARRGYRLLGDWTVRYQCAARPPVGPQKLPTAAASPPTNLPATVARVIGRSSAVRRLRDLISAYRVVTLTGTGGIGKTTLALKVAHRVLSGFPDGGWLVELASLSDPRLVPSAVAQVLGLRLGSDVISAEAVARAVAGRKLLLVLDNCEHVIDAAAELAEIFLRLCPRITILATSREVFRIEGECVYRVPPLDVPAPDQVDADQIRGRSAPDLFIARTRELGWDFSSDPADLLRIATICRHLDGIPLAIEFAAARAAALGIEQVAEGLRDRFARLTSGRRTALPRHQTLRATLDWSYHLLPDSERLLLQRLAIFSGGFSLDAANAVANDGPGSEAEIAEGLVNLVAKSLVIPDFSEGRGYLRLLETTRAYALSKLTETRDPREFSKRHAEYYTGLFEGIAYEWEARSVSPADIDNVRAALEWCFGVNGNLTVGVGLAAASAPVFLAMSLLAECHRWSERAIRALDEAARGGPKEMHLQACLGVSSMQMHGQSDAARVALSRGLTIAQARADVLNQVELLGMLSMFDARNGDFKTSMQFARLSRIVDGVEENAAAKALANSIFGRALQFVGEHDASREELEASFRYWSDSQRESEVYLGLDHHILVGIGLARSLWLQGHPAQSTARLCQTIKDAEAKNQPASLGLALSWAPGLFLWTGDLLNAEEHADWLTAHAESHLLGPYLVVARAYKAVLAIGRGNAKVGAGTLQGCLEQLRAIHYEMLNTEFRLILAQGLTAIGQFGEGLTLVEETIRLVETNGDLVHMPEALRVTGNIILSTPGRRAQDAEMCFIRSLDWSRRQGARSWELRTAVDLAALWTAQGQRERARMVLEPIFEQFVEGFDTADPRAAKQLLARLR